MFCLCTIAWMGWGMVHVFWSASAAGEGGERGEEGRRGGEEEGGGRGEKVHGRDSQWSRQSGEGKEEYIT